MPDRRTHLDPIHLHGAWAQLVDGRVLIECSGEPHLELLTLDVTAFAHILARDLLVAHIEREANDDDDG